MKSMYYYYEIAFILSGRGIYYTCHPLFGDHAALLLTTHTRLIIIRPNVRPLVIDQFIINIRYYYHHAIVYCQCKRNEINASNPQIMISNGASNLHILV